MSEEIKEILENIKRQNEWKGVEYFRTPLSNEDADKLLDYITNLQEDLDKANEIIEKDRQFYECRLKEWLDYKTRLERALLYIEERFIYEEDTGAYYLTHTFDGDNVFELWRILKGGK